MSRKVKTTCIWQYSDFIGKDKIALPRLPATIAYETGFRVFWSIKKFISTFTDRGKIEDCSGKLLGNFYG